MDEQNAPALISTECDFTGCGKLRAQAALEQEGPALPSLRDAPAAWVTSSTLRLPPANWIHFNSNNKICNILALGISTSQDSISCSSYREEVAAAWSERGGRNCFNSRWLSDLFSYNTKLCSQDHNVKQSSFSKGTGLVLYSWKEQGLLFKFTWSEDKQEFPLKNQSHLFPPSKCCDKCHPVLPAETSACTARESNNGTKASKIAQQNI